MVQRSVPNKGCGARRGGEKVMRVSWFVRFLLLVCSEDLSSVGAFSGPLCVNSRASNDFARECHIFRAGLKAAPPRQLD